MYTRFNFIYAALLASSIGCHLDRPHGVIRTWADYNSIGQPAIFIDDLRTDSFRTEPPITGLPDVKPAQFFTGSPAHREYQAIPPTGTTGHPADALRGDTVTDELLPPDQPSPAPDEGVNLFEPVGAPQASVTGSQRFPSSASLSPDPISDHHESISHAQASHSVRAPGCSPQPLRAVAPREDLRHSRLPPPPPPLSAIHDAPTVFHVSAIQLPRPIKAPSEPARRPAREGVRPAGTWLF